MKKLLAGCLVVGSITAAACGGKKSSSSSMPTPTSENATVVPQSGSDAEGSSAIGEPQEPSDMRPMGAPTPANTEENRTGRSNQN